MMYDVVVVGGGLAGLIAGLSAQSAGCCTAVVTGGEGTALVSSGCIDILGYMPDDHSPVEDPLAAIHTLARECPEHPYAKTGIETVEHAVAFFKEHMAWAGIPYKGDLRRNRRIPTTAGTYRITSLVPFTMEHGDLSQEGKTVIVGFEGYRDFWADLVVLGLNRFLNHKATAMTITSTAIDVSVTQNPVALARALEKDRRVLEHVCGVIDSARTGIDRAGFPAVLGVREPGRLFDLLQERLGIKVFEIPTLPPSIPARRMVKALKDSIFLGGGTVESGFSAIKADCAGDRCLRVMTEHKEYQARAFVMATGTFFGRGIVSERERMYEPLLGLPLSGAEAFVGNGFSQEFLDPRGHPIGGIGVATDRLLRPVDSRGSPLWKNVFFSGDILAHHNPYSAKSGAGVALVTGYRAGINASDAV